MSIRSSLGSHLNCAAAQFQPDVRILLHSVAPPPPLYFELKGTTWIIHIFPCAHRSLRLLSDQKTDHFKKRGKAARQRFQIGDLWMEWRTVFPTKIQDKVVSRKYCMMKIIRWSENWAPPQVDAEKLLCLGRCVKMLQGQNQSQAFNRWAPTRMHAERGGSFYRWLKVNSLLEAGSALFMSPCGVSPVDVAAATTTK